MSSSSRDSLSPRHGFVQLSSFDSLTSPGSYRVNLTSCADKPDGAYNWGFVFVSRTDDLSLVQLYASDGCPCQVFLRMKYGDNAWRPWSRLNTTAAS